MTGRDAWGTDDPRRVAGPEELPEDFPDPEPEDAMEAYKRMLEAEDAERDRRPKSVMQTFEEIFRKP